MSKVKGAGQSREKNVGGLLPLFGEDSSAAGSLGASGKPAHEIPADQHHRLRLERDFDCSLLVEAGAGSGKTHSLARRMAAGIAAGHYQIEHMAAVTFTRKAAAELRGRFQLALEEMLRAGGLPPGERARIERALSNLERFYAGTIHAFCAHLLRERPVDSGIAPGFTELDEAQDNRRREESWRDYISQARARGKLELVELLAAGVKARDLDSAFRIVSLYEEVDFPVGDGERPDVDAALAALQDFWDPLRKLLPARIRDDSKCKVLEKAAEFRRKLRVLDPDMPASLVACLELWQGTTLRVTQKWWDSRSHALDAQARFEEFRDTVVQPFLTEWRQYLYRLSVTVLLEAREYARRERRRHNTLNYSDLLQEAAGVLREKPLVRRALQQKYRWLFVDEFQDTDPVQAEIIVWLAADEESLTTTPSDWTQAKLRSGALFVVGDPKQSIYRFRRADIDIYTRVKQQIRDSCGEVVPLTANFRSVESLCGWANDVFVTKFPAEATQHAPAFERLDAFRKSAARRTEEGVRTLTVPETVDEKQVAEQEADAIARYIRHEVAEGRRDFGQFLILTRKKKSLAVYASALERHQVPLEVSGAGAFGFSEEVRSLSVLLRALADPQDSVALVGALRGPFFGISDPELFDFVQSGKRLWLWAGVEGDRTPNQLAQPPGRTNRLNQPAEPVGEALASLRAMHRWTRLLPPAAAVDRILEGTGYLALGGTSPSGAAAGDLLHAIDRIRQVSEEGGTLMDAVQALDDDEEASSEIDSLPLEPGRTDVVRVMNLHKAKGLEAPVVFLADPCGGFNPRVDVRIERDGASAKGYFRLEPKNKDGWVVRALAEPPDWDVHAAAEQQYLTAEGDRLLYVAATRARDQLVIGRWAKSGGRGTRAWDAFDPWLKGVAELEVPKKVTLPTPAMRDLSATALDSAAAARAASHARVTTPAWSVTSVTAEARHIAKVVRHVEADPDDPARTVTQDTPTHRADAGMAWGTLVHGLLEHAMRHPEATSDDLRRLALWLTVEEPQLRSVLDRAVALVQEVSRAPFWQEAQASVEHHVEAPFAVVDARAVLTGVIDLVYRSGATWELVDYKTDRASAPAANEAYKQQIERYSHAWRTITGLSPGISIRHLKELGLSPQSETRI